MASTASQKADACARDLERFAKRHHQAFAAALDLELTKAPCDSTFLYLFERVELEELFGLLREWMLAMIADQNKDFDQLICDGKTLRGSAAQLDGPDGATRFVTQVTLYARELGVAIAQTSFDTGESHERAALKALLSTLELAAEQGADLLLTVKNNQRRLYQQIVSQFRGHQHFPVVSGDVEASHGRRVRWTLRARNATEAIRERWAGASWIIELVSTGRRDGKPFHHIHFFITTLRTSPKALLRLVRQRWAIENHWHWPRDTQLGEDAHRYSQRNGVQVLALLRTLTL